MDRLKIAKLDYLVYSTLFCRPLCLYSLLRSRCQNNIDENNNNAHLTTHLHRLLFYFIFKMKLDNGVFWHHTLIILMNKETIMKIQSFDAVLECRSDNMLIFCLLA